MNGLVSLPFILWTLVVALIIGMILGLLHGADRVYRDSKAWYLIRLAIELILQALESIPAAALILVGCWLAIGFDTDLHRMLFLGFLGGIIWSVVVARTISNRISFEFEREYTHQLSLWGLDPIYFVVLRLVINKHRRELAASATIIVIYSLVADTSIGFILKFVPEFQEAPIRYYQGSFGDYLASMLTDSGQSGQFAIMVIFLGLLILGLVIIVDFLEHLPNEVKDFIDRTYSSPENETVFTVQKMRVEVSNGAKRNNFVLRTEDFHDSDKKEEKTKELSMINYFMLFCSAISGIFGFNKNDWNLSNKKNLPIKSITGNLPILEVGKVLWVSGEAGSGKSLFFKSLLGLLPNGATAEGVIVMNTNKKGKEGGKNISVIFQEPSLYLYPYMQVNTMADLVAGRKWKDICLPRFPEAQSKIGKQYVDQLSAGQKRIIFASLVFYQLSKDDCNRLLLCDEPDSSLDQVSREILVEYLAKLIKTKGFGMAYITHNPSIMEIINNEGIEINEIECRLKGNRSILSYANSINILRSTPVKQKTVNNSNLCNLMNHEFVRKSILDSLFVSDIRVFFPDGTSSLDFCKKHPLQLFRNRVYILQGGNGKGKSTLLKGISGYFASTAKEIRVGLQAEGNMLDRMGWRTRRKYIGHVFDDTEKSLMNNVIIGEWLEPLARKAHDYPENLNEFVSFMEKEEFGLSNILECFPMELSGGMRQVLVYGIGRYIVKRKLMLFDEPFSRLHIDWEEILIKDMIKAATKNSMTFVVISHRISESLRKEKKVSTLQIDRYLQ